MHNNDFFSLEGPLDSIPASRQTRSANLAGYPGLIRSLGGDPLPLLERHGLNQQAIRDPDHFIDCKAVVDLLEDSSTALRAPLFGVQLAQRQDPEVFGCVATLCRAAPTVRDALASFIEYIPIVHSPEAMLELVEGAETAEIRWRVGHDLGTNHQANYKAALLNLKLLRMVGGRNFRPNYVNLAVSPRSADIAELEQQLGSKFNPTTGDNAIAFPVSVLNQAVASSNRLVYRLLGGYLEQVKAACRTTVADRVEDYVRGALAGGGCSIERCAMKLNVSVRTLQTQLADAGLKFSDILEAQRCELARRYLEQDNLSLDDVADMLGYAEQSSFGRAFKRWTGLTPKLYRQQLESSRRRTMPAAFSLAFANRAAGI
jgi:AraC-like DNA-binding protein